MALCSVLTQLFSGDGITGKIKDLYSIATSQQGGKVLEILSDPTKATQIIRFLGFDKELKYL